MVSFAEDRRADIFEIGLCGFLIRPFALGDYHYLYQEGFRESGANSINLRVHGKTQHMFRAEAGLRTSYEFLECDYCIAPYLGLSWVGEFPLHTSHQRASFTGQSCVMNIQRYHSDRHLASPEAGLKFTRCNGLSILSGYKGLFDSDTRIHQLELRMEWVF